MTDGASGKSVDELPESADPFSAIALGLVILIFIVLSGMAGYNLGKHSECPGPVYHLKPHKHEAGK